MVDGDRAVCLVFENDLVGSSPAIARGSGPADGSWLSMPFCVSGSAAMKITSSTSSTSISGVRFISTRGRGISACTIRLASS